MPRGQLLRTLHLGELQLDDLDPPLRRSTQLALPIELLDDILQFALPLLARGRTGCVPTQGRRPREPVSFLFLLRVSSARLFEPCRLLFVLLQLALDVGELGKDLPPNGT
jgi:hypothetical protein